MAKSLGQIHTANFDHTIQVAEFVSGDKYLYDLSAALCSNLQTMVRQGNFFKCVGIDMTVEEQGGSGHGGTISGQLRYYAPTRGRCEAYKNAFHAVREGMRLQGINMRGNRNYDFRVPIDKLSDYKNESEFLNQATIDGTNGLSLTGASSLTDDIFGVYNANIQPQQTATVAFNSGFGLPGNPGSATDFVVDGTEGEIFDASLTRQAQVALESIPFQLTYTPGSTNTTFEFEWRPDPALYLAVMCGMFELVVEELNVSDNSVTALNVHTAVHVSGWKSIMGNPDRKRRSSKKKSSRKGAKK